MLILFIHSLSGSLPLPKRSLRNHPPSLPLTKRRSTEKLHLPQRSLTEKSPSPPTKLDREEKLETNPKRQLVDFFKDWVRWTKYTRLSWHAFAIMSFIAETFIFLYVGMDALDIEKWKMSKASVWTSVIVWWAGLMRGVVSIALAFNQFTYSGITSNPTQATMVTSTVIVVFFTTLVFGSFTKPLVNLLIPQHALDNTENTSRDELNLPLIAVEDSTTTNMVCARNSLSMLLNRPVYAIHYYWRQFDDSYMRPVFGRARN